MLSPWVSWLCRREDTWGVLGSSSFPLPSPPHLRGIDTFLAPRSLSQSAMTWDEWAWALREQNPIPPGPRALQHCCCPGLGKAARCLCLKQAGASHQVSCPCSGALAQLEWPLWLCLCCLLSRAPSTSDGLRAPWQGEAAVFSSWRRPVPATSRQCPARQHLQPRLCLESTNRPLGKQPAGECSACDPRRAGWVATCPAQALRVPHGRGSTREGQEEATPRANLKLKKCMRAGRGSPCL